LQKDAIGCKGCDGIRQSAEFKNVSQRLSISSIHKSNNFREASCALYLADQMAKAQWASLVNPTIEFLEHFRVLSSELEMAYAELRAHFMPELPSVCASGRG